MAARKKVGTVRSALVSLLEEHLPSAWRLEPYRRKADAIKATTVYLKLGSVERIPEAPMSGHVASFTVTVADPATDWAQADAALDDNVIELVMLLNRADAVKAARAEAVVVNDTYLGFDISVEVIATATPTQE